MPSQTHTTLDSGHSTPPSDDEVLVRVEGVSKKFCRSLKKSLWYGVCDIASELNPFGRNTGQSTANKNLTTEDTESTEGGTGLRLSGPAGAAFSNPTTSGLAVDSQNTSLARAASNPCSSGEKALDSSSGLRAGEFFAVKDVSFELRRGECLGLIGHNGAGKTTLLKMLNGLIKPDAGSITMRGRVGALIALGAGFNPILTGRENIYINGSVLGLTKKEIDAKIDEIIDFAEIREAIDMPVMNYSSGMSVRLGFSVATSMSPDVLILDEVLAVGDIGFVIKCLNRVRKMSARAAVILVSHNMQSISSFCSRVIFMGHGRTLLDTLEPAEAIDRYYEMISSERNETGSGEAKIKQINLKQGKVINQGEIAELCLEFEVAPSCDTANLHIYIMDEALQPIVCLPVIDSSGELRDFVSGIHQIAIPLGCLDLVSGKYSFTVAITDKHTKQALIRSQGLQEFRVFATKAHWGRIVRPTVVS